jgi:starvation-inducible outer membrane lipoprotein
VKKPIILITIFFVTLTLAACNQDKPVQLTTQTAQPAVPAVESVPTPAAASGRFSGTVIETMNTAGYTYVNVDDGTKKIWAAAPEFSVKIGDQVMVPEGMEMYNYHSQTLNRDFPIVYFVGSILNASNPAMATLPSADMQKPAGHPPITRKAAPPEIDLTNVQKATGGMTIGEIYADKADLSGKTVTLRGKVVKFSPQIMDTNWIHLQDGSGDLNIGTHDLTITSHVQVKVGDTLVASGALTLDKDFGYGYKYDLIIENAAVTVE